jgi:hypothetical protein
MQGAIQSSEAARDLPRRRAAREEVEVTLENIEAHLEPAEADVMEPFSGFMKRPEAVLRFMEDGRNRRDELRRVPSTPSAMVRWIMRTSSPMGESVLDVSRTTSSCRMPCASRRSWAITVPIRSRNRSFAHALDASAPISSALSSGFKPPESTKSRRPVPLPPPMISMSRRAFIFPHRTKFARSRIEILLVCGRKKPSSTAA